MNGKFRSMLRLAAAGLALSAIAGCSKHSGTDRARPAMSERQRDSTIARSRLPGGGVVGTAISVSDSAAARAARADSLARQ
jgi:hypothetical protein